MLANRRIQLSIKSVPMLLERAGELGARFRLSAGRVEVLGLNNLPVRIVKDLKAQSKPILTYLIDKSEICPWTEMGSGLLAWSASAAELGLETQSPVTFTPCNAEPVTTRRVGLYAGGFLTHLAQSWMGSGHRRKSFTHDEEQTLRSLAMLREAVELVSHHYAS